MMKASSVFFLAPVLVGSFALGQTRTLKKGDRPVFYSAKQLAEDCQKFLKVFPNGKPLPNTDELRTYEMEQLVGAAKCKAYIAGVNDGQLEGSFSSHYHPIRSEMDYLGPLVGTFLKYVSGHPEEEDFAASTALGAAEKIVSNAQGVR